MAAGYSATSLPKKLGITARSRVLIVGAPPGFATTLGPLGDEVTVSTGDTTGAGGATFDTVLYFTTSRAELEERRESLGRMIFPSGAAWVCWPKRASKVPTDVTEDVVREVVLPHGLVDVKVCAVDDVWSGLKLMWRRERRS